MTKKTDASAVPAAEAKSKAAPPPAESVYTADELAANAALFKTRKECVATALRVAGKGSTTVSEAKKIVADFLHKEVR